MGIKRLICSSHTEFFHGVLRYITCNTEISSLYCSLLETHCFLDKFPLGSQISHRHHFKRVQIVQLPSVQCPEAIKV